MGVYSVEERLYVPYRGSHIVAVAIPRIAAAREVITYNGTRSDLSDLGKWAGLSGDLPLTGIHTDMESVCWGNINGRNLPGTYAMHPEPCPPFPDTYEGSNERDCYMTFKLWEWWKLGTLKVIDGYYR
jgi:hypothetical protein